jgi:hypothetical protein
MCPILCDHTDHIRSTRCAKQDYEKITAVQFSSLTGAGCGSGSRTQTLRLSSDHEVRQSRQEQWKRAGRYLLFPIRL